MENSKGAFRLKSIYTTIERPLLIHDEDTVILKCKFVDTIAIDTGMLFIPKYNLPFVIYKISPDSTMIYDGRMDQGTYVVRYIDTLDCRVISQNITIIDSIDCESPQNIPNQGSGSTEIENIRDNKIIIYPNPNSGSMVLQFDYIDNYSYSITSFEGKRIVTGSIRKDQIEEDGQFILNLNALPDGVYTIQLNNKATLTSRRFVIIH